MSSIDLRLVDELVDFVRGPGFVLDFSDTGFADFFLTEVKINIDEAKYAVRGSSKGKRLRYFLQNCDDATAIQTLSALWEYRTDYLARSGEDDPVKNVEARYRSLLDRLSATGAKKPKDNEIDPAPEIDRIKIAKIKTDLMQVTSLSPQARGFAFEKFLKILFDVYGLKAHASFRLQGEQIDGSFQLGSETYLLEAKWQGKPTGVADLHVFHGKIEQKAAWARGLFISTNGFTEDGLVAFGKGKRIICMDGLDLFEILDQEISFSEVLERKVRRAAETGSPFIRVRDLFSY